VPDLAATQRDQLFRYSTNQTAGQPGTPQPSSPSYRLYGVDWTNKTQPQFNSNYPERLTKLNHGDITLSTLSPTGRTDIDAHLDYAFTGKFRVLISHINLTNVRAYQVFVLRNPGSGNVNVKVNALASTDDATGPPPYHQRYNDLEGRVEARNAVIDYSGQANGPGDRTASRILLGKVQQDLFESRREYQPGSLVIGIPAGETRVVQAPLHGAGGRALVTQAELESDGPVEAAVVYTTKKTTDPEVDALLKTGRLVARDKSSDGRGQVDVNGQPKVANGASFGQVGGVVQHSTFEGSITNGPLCARHFYVFNMKRGQEYRLGGDRSAAWVRVEKPSADPTKRPPPTPFTTEHGSMASRDDAADLIGAGPRTGILPAVWYYLGRSKFYHDQNADLRYGALKSHGNYGAEFVITGNFQNATEQSMQVRVFIDTPEELDAGVSRSLRNTFEVRKATSSNGVDSAAPRYFYASQKANQPRGTTSEKPIFEVTLGANQSESARIRVFYAANNTAPHVLRVETGPAPTSQATARSTSPAVR
jgi:hypothetical protein